VAGVEVEESMFARIRLTSAPDRARRMTQRSCSWLETEVHFDHSAALRAVHCETKPPVNILRPRSSAMPYAVLWFPPIPSCYLERSLQGADNLDRGGQILPS
jgi:hypothetical protein